MKFKIIKFFDENQLKIIQNELKHCKWESGLKTISDHNVKIKNNLQSSISTDFLYSSLDNNDKFLDFVVPDTTTLPIISKTPTNGYYHAHFDSFDNGHFSTTIFLNSPDEYFGGELCLLLDGEEKKIKLEPGYGITYETGTVHRVNTVTKGERVVCVFWTKTKIRDMEDLYKYRYYNDMCKRYDSNNIYDDCLDFSKDMHNHFYEKALKIMRKWI